MMDHAHGIYNPWDIMDGLLLMIHNLGLLWMGASYMYNIYNILPDMGCSIYNFMHTMILLTLIPQYFGWSTENYIFCILQYECSELYPPGSSW